MTTLDLSHAIIDALEDKKGEDILLLDVHELTSITDHFVICTATSNRMLNALADAVREKILDEFKKKGRSQGSPQAGWIVLDYGDVVIHLFEPELRRFYRLEELWKDGKVLLRLQ